MIVLFVFVGFVGLGFRVFVLFVFVSFVGLGFRVFVLFVFVCFVSLGFRVFVLFVFVCFVGLGFRVFLLFVNIFSKFRIFKKRFFEYFPSPKRKIFLKNICSNFQLSNNNNVISVEGCQGTIKGFFFFSNFSSRSIGEDL